jgi:succinate-semialdehyde dehydrogenase/glutarate-semialdehyde dehydrogenase
MQLKDPSLLKSHCFIDGQWVGADDGTSSEVRNPATGALVSRVPNAGAAETQRAIDGAARAFPAWSARTAEERARVLRRWYELMMEHQEDLAILMTSEQGKPLAESRGEIGYAASFIDWFAEEARRVYGVTIPSPWPDKRIVVTREPVGVCAAITPWNFPAAMITRKAGPALAAGCTMIVKPAGQTPLSALAMAELATRAGVPAGALSVVTGQARVIGAALTGAPFIVFDDADLEAAVEGAMISKYRNTGQTCVCANRLLVQAGIYEAFAARLTARVAALRVGDGLQPGVEQGPLIDAAALAKVEELMADARAHGARILTGGARHALGGTFYQPTVLTEAAPAMRLAHEEIFGPVAPLYRFQDEAEAIRLANASEYGLASYFYSRDVGRVWRVARALECGIVGINTGLISTAVAPFGGVKQSGLGREGSYCGIDEFLDIKYLCMGGL